MKWVYLSLLLLVYILNQWDRYLFVYLSGVAISECPSAAKGDPCFTPNNATKEPPLCSSFTCTTDHCRTCQQCYDEHDASYYNLKYASCLSEPQYGVLVSFGFVLLFAFAGLVAGQLSDRLNRRNIIGMSLLAWSLFTVGQGISSTFALLLVFRLGLGLFQAFTAPASYSLIAEVFPVEMRGRANGIYSFGVYVGGGLGSLSIVLANTIGWRGTCYLCGGLGVAVAALLVVLVAEPPREQTAAPVEPSRDDDEGLLNPPDEHRGDGKRPTLFSSLCTRVLIALFLAASFRFVGGLVIGSYLPQYYKRRFPGENKSYSVLNAFVVSFGGALSSYLGGVLCDRWSLSDLRARAWVPALGCVFGFLPFIGVIYADNFYASIAFLFLEYLIAESWFAGALSIVQNQVNPEFRGQAIAAYLFFASMFGNVGPTTVGFLDDGTTDTLGTIILAMVGLSYGVAATLFVLCGVFLGGQQRRTVPVDLEGLDTPLITQQDDEDQLIAS